MFTPTCFRVDLEHVVLVAADDAVADLGVNPRVPRGGQQFENLRPHGRVLVDAGVVHGLGELGRVVVHVWEEPQMVPG